MIYKQIELIFKTNVVYNFILLIRFQDHYKATYLR